MMSSFEGENTGAKSAVPRTFERKDRAKLEGAELCNLGMGRAPAGAWFNQRGIPIGGRTRIPRVGSA